MRKKLFSLEDSIMECWNVTSDIKVVYQEWLDSPTPMDEDEIANILIGMETLYNRKFERLFREYEEALGEQRALIDNED